MQRLAISSLALVPLVLFGCDSLTGGGGHEGPYTRCDYAIVEVNPGAGDFGEGCESNDDCEYGVCLLPGDPGNLTNAAFGFCTRGCDCNDDVTSRLSSDEQAAGLRCIYPPTPAQHRRHVVVGCGSTAQCQALDPRWTSCRAPTSGGTRPICHAD